MAATTPIVEGRSFEEFVSLHAERFTAYLRGMLGLQAEGRGGRVPVDDTLQDALLAIYSEWPELRDVRDDERDRRMYRCLRDAAGRALRAELGRRGSETSRPQLVSLDRLMQSLDDDAPARDRELTASLLGTMVRDMSERETAHNAQMTLSRGILVGGLRALTEREAVVLIAVDYLGWEQQQLSERLGVGYSSVRQTLFVARKIFYTLVRHAAGVEVEDEERARLVAYLSGELRGAEKREVARHLRHCTACQQLQREMDAFGGRAVAVLAPLPFLFGAKVLAKKSSVKAATVGERGGHRVAYAARRGKGRRRGGQSAVGRRRHVGGTGAARAAPPSRRGPTTRFDLRRCFGAAAAGRDAPPSHAVELHDVFPDRVWRVVSEGDS
jgi:DNA-directed RNA polymerase specialized sigma24 family protein